MKRLISLLFVAIGLCGCVTLANAEPVSFQLQDMGPDGGRYDSAAHAGKPIVIEYFFNSCRYCNDNARNVKEIAQEWHGDRAQVIEVSIDCERSQYDAWFRKHSPITPVLNDCDGEILGRMLGVSSYPTTIILDKNHQRLWSSVGVWSSAKKAKIRQLLTQQTR